MRTYRDGTLSLTIASTAITGVGTLFVANVGVGDIIICENSQCFEVVSVIDDTHLTVDVAAKASGSFKYGALRFVTAVNFRDLTVKIEQFLYGRQTNLNEFTAWMTGTRTGGVLSDGYYPMTDRYGVTKQYACPELLAYGYEDTLVQATAAAASAADALSSQMAHNLIPNFGLAAGGKLWSAVTAGLTAAYADYNFAGVPAACPDDRVGILTNSTTGTSRRIVFPVQSSPVINTTRCVAGEQIDVSFWVNAAGTAANTVCFMARFYNEAGTQLGDVKGVYYDQVLAGWQKLSGFLVAPASSAKVDFSILLETATPTNQKIYFTEPYASRRNGANSYLTPFIDATDANKILTSGFQRVATTTTNIPLALAGNIFCAMSSPTVGTQYYVSSTNRSFTRVMSGTWGSWAEQAMLASPALTGTPTAPTAAVGTNSTQLATTAFVQTAANGMLTKSIAGAANVTLTAAEAFNATLKLTGVITANIAVIVPATAGYWRVINATTGAFTVTLKTPAGTGIVCGQGLTRVLTCDGVNVIDAFTDFADIDLTGVPTAPTAPTGASTNQLATTAFVQQEILNDTGTANPLMNAAVSVGVATKFSREDHVHPIDTSRAPLASPGLTGNPTAPTSAAGDNDTSIATTAFVQGAVNGVSSISAAGTGTLTLTAAQAGVSIIAFTGVLTGAKTIVMPAGVKGQWTIVNQTTGAFSLTVKYAAGNSVVVTQGMASNIWGDSVNVALQQTDFISPAFTGTPTAPTATNGTNTTQVATTAFVQQEADDRTATVNPLMNGAVAIGVSIKLARQDHVHPIDTSRAPLASPGLTGTPTAPTATAGTNTTQIATTAFVGTAVANLVASSPAALDTLNELAAALGNDPNFATSISTALGLKAPLDSPALTGVPTAPTAATATSTTQVATTAFVQQEIAADLATVAPPMNGSAAVGSSTKLARENHVHPVDTSRAAVASPSLTGTPLSTTAAAGTNTTQIATTAFVQVAANGMLTKSIAGGVDVTLTTTEAGYAILKFTGVLTANINVIVPTTVGQWRVANNTTGAFTLTVKTVAGTGVGITQGLTWGVFCDGTNVLDGLTDFFSTAMTGIPTSPTAANLTNTTQIATTAFVRQELNGDLATATSPMNGAAAVGVSTKLARQDHVHPVDTSRAPLAAPALTGVPTAPTAATGTNSTQLATTAFVQQEITNDLATATPLMNGTGAVGNSTKLARENHVHPTDTSRAPLASPGLTGVPTAPTAAAATNTTQIATTAFVQTEITNIGLTQSGATQPVGTNSTQWATTEFVNKAIGSYATVAMAGTGNTTATALQYGAFFLSLTGALTGNVTLTMPTTLPGNWAIDNNTTGAFTVTIKSGAGTTVVVTQGRTVYVTSDGTNVQHVTEEVKDLNLTGTLTTTGPINESLTQTIASAAALPVTSTTANSLIVTGTTTITSLSTATAGIKRSVTFSGILTLTHNATTLILPGAANITTAVGDVAEFVSLGGGNWRCCNYSRANGKAVALGNVDNTSDVNKPISTATQAALDAKQPSLGFTAVQQGTGVGQGTNLVKIGWASGTSEVKITVDTTDLGAFVLKSFLANSATIAAATTATASTLVQRDASSNIVAKRAILTGSGSDYNAGAVEAQGNGAANTVYPTIGFHQPTLYGGSIQQRDATTFYFYNQGATDYNHIVAKNITATGTVGVAGGVTAVTFTASAQVTAAAVYAKATSSGVSAPFYMYGESSQLRGVIYASADNVIRFQAGSTTTGLTIAPDGNCSVAANLLASGYTWAAGRAYTNSGASYLDTNGDTYGSVWGGYLSTWLNANCLTTSNMRTNLANMRGGELGSFVQAAYVPAGPINLNAGVVGSSLRNCSSQGSNPGVGLPGNWDCCGYINAALENTLWHRYV